MSRSGAFRYGLANGAVLEQRSLAPHLVRLQSGAPLTCRSGACATTSAAARRHRRTSPATTHTGHPGGWAHPAVVAAAKPRGDRDDGNRGPRDRGFQFSSRRGYYRVQFNDYEAEVRQDEAWKLLVPMLGGIVVATAVIGPLIIGIAFTAVALGAALSAGALFTSLFLPFFLFIGAGALLFGGLTFSAFATLGTALLLPKLISLAVAAGGLGMGALAVSLFLKPAKDRAKVSYEEAARDADSASRKSARRPQQDPEVIVEAEEDPEVERQLREFDELLAGREEQRRRTDRFR